MFLVTFYFSGLDKLLDMNVYTGLQLLDTKLCPKILKFTGIADILTLKTCHILNIPLKQNPINDNYFKTIRNRTSEK